MGRIVIRNDKDRDISDTFVNLCIFLWIDQMERYYVLNALALFSELVVYEVVPRFLTESEVKIRNLRLTLSLDYSFDSLE